MENIYEVVLEVLSRNEKYLSEENQLLKAKVYADIMSMDKELLTLLMTNENIKKEFFFNVSGTLVFDKQKFAWLIESKEFLPDSYTKYSNKIGLTVNSNFISQKNDVVLDFPYKDCYLQGGQDKDEQKRDEIFYHEIIASDQISRMLEPKVFTNAKRYTKDGIEANIEFKYDDNLIIKGNNLIALSSILKVYEGRIKCIYIDVPFNTGSDSFKYNDSFNHSTWLTFMKNRLVLSKKLLSENSTIFIHCDDNEQAYLRVLCDEIFGKNNFINTISLLSSTPSGLKTTHKEKTIIKTKDYIHVYKKGDIKIKPQYVEVTEWDTHFNLFFDKKKNIVRPLKEIIIENQIYEKTIPLKKYSLNNPAFFDFVYKYAENIFQTGKSMPETIREKSLQPKYKNIPLKYGEEPTVEYAYNGRRMSFLSNSINEVLIKNKKEQRISKLLCDFWWDIDFNNSQNEGGVSFPSGKKPEKLLLRIIELVTEPGDIILDFFLGAGTTAAVAHKIGRKYIGIEQMDYVKEITVKRLKNVIYGEKNGISKAISWQGGGSFVYFELLENSQELINEILNATEDEINLIKEKIYDDVRIVPFITREELKKVDSEFQELDLKNKKKALISLLDKNKLYVNLSDIDDENYNIKHEDKKFTKSFYEKEV